MGEGGIVQEIESPDFRSLEVCISVTVAVRFVFI